MQLNEWSCITKGDKMRRGIALLVVLAFVVAVAAPAFAGNQARDVADYSGKVVTGSVNTVGEATNATAKTAVSPLTALWRSLTGQDTPEKIVTDPVNQGGKTLNDAAVNTGKTLEGKK